VPPLNPGDWVLFDSNLSYGLCSRPARVVRISGQRVYAEEPRYCKDVLEHWDQFFRPLKSVVAKARDEAHGNALADLSMKMWRLREQQLVAMNKKWREECQTAWDHLMGGSNG